MNDDKAATAVQNYFINNKTVELDIRKMNLSDLNDSLSYCEYIKSTVNSIDGLILNAGIGMYVPFGSINYSEWQKVLDTNVTIPIFMIQSLLEPLKRSISNEGIVMSGSIMGKYSHSSSLAYGITKSAVHAAVRNLVKFLSPFNLRINATAAGFTRTSWHEQKAEDFFDRISKKIGVQRWATPEEIAEAYVFCLNNKYMNGSVLEIDGGYNYF